MWRREKEHSKALGSMPLPSPTPSPHARHRCTAQRDNLGFD
jgi:hypothetical protein